MHIRVEAEVETDEAIAIDKEVEPTPVGLLPDDVMQFLLPSRYCPSDRMEGRRRESLGRRRRGLRAGGGHQGLDSRQHRVQVRRQ
jgi:hypothetical protein